MCSLCWPEKVQWSERNEVLEFPQDHMVYNDGPLAGEARCRHCKQWFAYVCDHPVWNTVCHWTLIPIDEPSSGEAPECYAAVARQAPAWLSMLEDRRFGPPHITAGVLRPPGDQVPCFD